MADEARRKIVDFFLNKGILVTADFIEEIEKKGLNLEELHTDSQVLLLDKAVHSLMGSENAKGVQWDELERLKAASEKRQSAPAYAQAIEKIKEAPLKVQAPEMEVLKSYHEKSKPRSVANFVSYFNHRYKAIERMLKGRPELGGLTSIIRVLSKREKDKVSVIGIVSNKRETKNHHIILTLEDSSGEIDVLISKNKPEMFEEASSIVLDEVIGIEGVSSEKIVFANNVVWPDIPFLEAKKSPNDEYACFLSDLHVGSNNYLGAEFEKFIDWTTGQTGNELQREIASKLKYIFIAGDLVDGVGIFPEQDKELAIKDIYAQYKACADILSRIPKHIKMIVCPGNHDATRISEPQPELSKDLAGPIWALPNVVMISNPGLINIGRCDGFSGFEVMVYHGYSFDYYVANVEKIRNSGGYDRADLIMKFLLKRRHVAPSHTSTLYVPDENQDPLVIDRVPDFFVTGHIHKSAVAQYKGTTMVCGSCWQKKTPFQEKVGHHPEPCLVPVVNLKTRNVKIMRFIEKDDGTA